MIEPKVNLSLSIPGAIMLTQEECDKDPKKNYNIETITVKSKAKKGKTHKENITIRTRKNRVVKQSMNISKEAYDYMTAANQPPTEKLAKKLIVTKIVGKDKNGKPKKIATESTVWAAQFNAVKRLDWHMARIAESLGAIDYKFEILDD